MATFDFSRYVWRQDEEIPTRMKREVGGAELFHDVLGTYKNGGLNLYLALYTTISHPLEASEFLRLLKKAWVSLRWDVPTVASRILHEPREGAPLPAGLLTYDLPHSASDVESWADQTVIFKEGYRDLDALRYDVGQGCIPDKDLDLQTFVYAVQFSETEFGVLLRTSHVPFDGTGIKIVGTKLLEHLARYISDPSYASKEESRLEWGSGSEREHLLPIASEILRRPEVDAPEVPAEPREGPEYLSTLQEVTENLAKGVSTIYPFNSIKDSLYDGTKEKQSNRRLSYTLTAEETQRIISTTKNPSDKLTINQLAHGALCLLTVLDNPPTPDSTDNVFTFGLINARNRLQPQYRGPEGYPGYCLAAPPTLIPVSIVDKYVTAAGGLEANIKAALLDFSHAVREQYKKHAAQPALLAIINQEVEVIVSSPAPTPWKGPWFAGDGRGSDYLRSKYPQAGPTAIEVTDFFVSLNQTEPGPFFRVTEWNGRIKLSIDYNEVPVESYVAEGLMKKWVDIILTFIS